MNNKEKTKMIMTYLDLLYPDARCELNYTKDYELLIATVLSAQCTDKRVNQVTEKLFSLYDLKALANIPVHDIEVIIRPVGTYTRKTLFIHEIANRLLNDWDGIVPNDKAYLTSLPGVGVKTANVVLGNVYNTPGIAVDTHVTRVSKRLRLCYEKDDVTKIENKLMKKFPKDKWVLLHHQMVLFGRYHCKARSPECSNCELRKICKIGEKLDKENII